MTKISSGYGQTTYSAIPSVNGRCIATVRDFVVLGASGDNYTIRWCALGDPTDWPTPNTDDARSKQAGSQDFPPQFGEITGIAGNDFYMYIFQERAVSKGVYVGGDIVFSFDTFEEGRGCIRPGRYVQVDDKVFFESLHGFHMVENDQIVDIGYGATDDSY